MANCRWCIYKNFITIEGIVDCYYYTYSYYSHICEHKDCPFFIDRDKIVKETLEEIKDE